MSSVLSNISKQEYINWFSNLDFIDMIHIYSYYTRIINERNQRNQRNTIKIIIKQLEDILDFAKTGKDEKSKIQSNMLENIINKLKNELLEEE